MGRRKIIKYLVNEKKANINLVDKEKKCTPLHYAILNKHYETAKYLIKNGADTEIMFNTCPSNRKYMGTPLWAVILSDAPDRLEIIELLLRHGAHTECVYSPPPKDRRYWETPLCYAVRHNDMPLVELLVKYGANVEGASAYGNSPLRLATLNGHVELVRYLLENEYRPASITSVNKRGHTIIDAALNRTRNK